MAKAEFFQSDFRGGIWSPSAQGRADDPRYKTALNESLNGMPVEEGAWVRRHGFRAAAFTRRGAAAKLLSLAGRKLYSYNAELSSGHIRLFRGAHLMRVGNFQRVTAISPLVTPAVITVGLEHGWATDDEVVFDIQNAAAVEELAVLTNRVFRIVVLSTTTFAIYDPITGAGFNGGLIEFDASMNVTVSKVADATTPYEGETWRDVRHVQTADHGTVLLSSQFHPQTLQIENAGDFAVSDISVEPSRFIDGPYLDQFKGVIATNSGTDGIVTVTFTFEDWDTNKVYEEGSYVKHNSAHWVSLVAQNDEEPGTGTQWAPSSPVSFFNGGHGLSDADIGRHIRLHSEPPEWANTSYSEGDYVKWNGNYWVALTNLSGSDPLEEPGVAADTWAVSSTSHRWTWGKITAIDSSSLVDVVASGTPIGDMTDGGALTKLFDGVKTTFDDDGAYANAETAYAGVNLDTPAEIGSARIYPAYLRPYYDEALEKWIIAGTFAVNAIGPSVVNLRARTAAEGAPSSPEDGTLLASSGLLPGLLTRNKPITLVSNDRTTVFKYVWMEIIIYPEEWTPYAVADPVTGDFPKQVCAAEMQFNSPATVSGEGISVQILGKPLLYEAAMHNWRLGRYNASDPTWPTTGCEHQGRLWLASGIGHFDASKSNEPFVFSPTEEDGSVPDNAAISYTFRSKSKNPIRWMDPGDNGIVMGDDASEWLVFATNENHILTPTNIQAERKSEFGSANVVPVRTKLTTVFVHENGRDVHEYMRDAYSGKLVAPSLTESAKHLSKGGIHEIARQASLTPILWACTKPGALIGTTYDRTDLLSAQPPRFNGWHRHVHGAGRRFVSVAPGLGLNGKLDTLQVVTLDPVTGRHRVELLADPFEVDDDIFAAAFLDGMIVPAGSTIFTKPTPLPVDDDDDGGGEPEPEEDGPDFECDCGEDIRQKYRISGLASGAANCDEIPSHLLCTNFQVPTGNYGENFTIQTSTGNKVVAFGPSQFSGTRMGLRHLLYFSQRAWDIRATYSILTDDYTFTKIEE